MRSLYELADIVFVGGSLIPHGGQSILEPAAVGKAIITGPYTDNFKAVVDAFLQEKALVQLPQTEGILPFSTMLFNEFDYLIRHDDYRNFLGTNAAKVIESNRGATDKTIASLANLLNSPK